MMSKSRQLAPILRTIAITACGLFAFTGRNGLAQELVKPENEDISLQGTIRLIHAFGPPGYGEDPKHDRRVTYWALDVTIPVNTLCTPEKPDYAKDDCGPAKRLNLYFDGLELVKFTDLPAAKWKDRNVIVRGKLHRADTLGEMTPIYMNVANISAPHPKRATTH